MNFRTVIDRVAASRGLTEGEARRAVAAVFAAVADTAAGGGRIVIRGFGTFSVGETAAHTGTNPKTGGQIAVPATKRLRFSTARTLKERLNRAAASRGAEPDA